jgi:hypothetical protein
MRAATGVALPPFEVGAPAAGPASVGSALGWTGPSEGAPAPAAMRHRIEPTETV